MDVLVLLVIVALLPLLSSLQLSLGRCYNLTHLIGYLLNSHHISIIPNHMIYRKKHILSIDQFKRGISSGHSNSRI